MLRKTLGLFAVMAVSAGSVLAQECPGECPAATTEKPVLQDVVVQVKEALVPQSAQLDESEGQPLYRFTKKLTGGVDKTIAAKTPANKKIARK